MFEDRAREDYMIQLWKHTRDVTRFGRSYSRQDVLNDLAKVIRARGETIPTLDEAVQEFGPWQNSGAR